MDLQSLFETVKAILLLVWSFDGVKVIVGHTGINLVVAVAAALHNHEFELGRVGEFLTRKLLPYVAVYFVIKAFGEAAGLTYLAPVVWAAIEASLTGDLMDNWTRLGLQLPESLAQLIVKRRP